MTPEETNILRRELERLEVEDWCRHRAAEIIMGMEIEYRPRKLIVMLRGMLDGR